MSDEEAAQKSMEYVYFSYTSTDESGSVTELTDEEKQKQNQLQKLSQNAQKQGKILRQLQQNSEQRCKKPHLMQRVHLRMQL